MTTKPEVGYGTWVLFENDEGEYAWLPRHLFGDDTSKKAVRKFTGMDNIVRTRVIHGFGARFVGPGHTDQSDWTVFHTLNEARGYISDSMEELEEIEESKEEKVSTSSHQLPDDHFAVFCKDDGKYVLATRGIFSTRKDAERYAEEISDSRGAVVIETDFISRLVDGWYVKD